MNTSRFKQADKEARMTLWVYAAFFVWWTVGAFGLGEWATVPLFGLPAWFTVSCVFGYPLVCITLWLVLKFGFRHMPLDANKSTSLQTATAKDASHE